MLESLVNLEPRVLLLGGALMIGLLFGLLGRASGFCLRSALVEFRLSRPGPRAIAWAAALLTAVAGAQVLAGSGRVDLAESLYLAPRLTLVSILLGGFLFGIGMVLARGCGGRHLVLASGGNLRSWLVLTTLALFAYATLRGILAPLRLWLEGLLSLELQAAGDQALPALLATQTGLAPHYLAIAVVALLVVGLAALLLHGLRAEAWRPAAWGHLMAGAGIGLLVPLAWIVTGLLGADEFEPVPLESMTFTAPVGDALQYLMTYTGATADFGILVVGGVLLGAVVLAVLRRDQRLESFATAGQLLRYLLGAALMGFGGVLALGCTIGAGLSGVSTLSLGSMIALAAIVAGARVALLIEARGSRILVPSLGRDRWSPSKS
ncbi:YeeE/YedE family protein [Algihabitans albus]|uniref:YeeE/YedE family protein n=1 Tax=Algihabitans albus TaxID=2164067 RepID=UPI000E5D9951|nr:YeeE/YedE family protein [Algihabitans albus]